MEALGHPGLCGALGLQHRPSPQTPICTSGTALGPRRELQPAQLPGSRRQRPGTRLHPHRSPDAPKPAPAVISSLGKRHSPRPSTFRAKAPDRVCLVHQAPALPAGPSSHTCQMPPSLAQDPPTAPPPWDRSSRGFSLLSDCISTLPPRWFSASHTGDARSSGWEASDVLVRQN